MKAHTIFDLDAEATLLASEAEGFWPSEPVPPNDHYAILHRSVAEVLDASRAAGTTPTIRLVVLGLGALGVRGPHLETAVARIMSNTPVAVRPDDIAHRVRSFAWRRRLALRLDRLRALLLEPAVSEMEIETEIDAFVEVAAQQPEKRAA